MITKQAPQALINSIIAWCPLFEQLQSAIIAGGFIRSLDCVGALLDLIEECKAYISGDRAQGKLFAA